jgi:hypothetical protein
MVDGVERGRLNPAEQSSISFSAAEDAEIIEVKTTDSSGELILATHLLASLPDAVFSIRLESGQELSLSITRRVIETNGAADFLVKFGYRETALRRVARLWWQRLGLRFSQDHESRGLWSGARIPILACSVLVICLVSYFGYLRLRSGEPEQTIRAQSTPLVAQVIEPPATAKPTEPPRAKSERSPAAKVVRERNEDAGSEVTRSGNVVTGVKLREVKKIYIEIRGDASLNELRERLNASGVVTATTNPDDADAALKIVVSQTSVTAQLVNARGTVLWRSAPRHSGETGKIVQDLLSEIRRERG